MQGRYGSDMRSVLGISVTDRMLERWRGWTMPAVQPFVVPVDVARDLRSVARKRTLTPELRDTFDLHDDPDDASRLIWLDKPGAARLPDDLRRASTHRWPTASVPYDTKRAIGFVSSGEPHSRHGDVSDGTWKRAAELLPDARRIAGRFRDRSGPDALGAVMGAAGVAGAEDRPTAPEAFQTWLDEVTIPGGNDELPGTVYVWRDDDSVIRHAGVSLGDGWYLHKGSAGWMTPTTVLDVRDGINASRLAGQYIQRHTVIPPHLR